MLSILAVILSLIVAELGAIIILLHRFRGNVKAPGIAQAPLFHFPQKPPIELPETPPFALSEEEIWADEAEK